MTVLSFHSVEMLLIACTARDRAIADGNRLNALTTDSIVAIVLSAAATEAFIHELADHIDVWRTNAADWPDVNMTEEMKTFADVIDDLEESRSSVVAKYSIGSLVIAGKSFRRDKAPYQDFKDLIGVRNAIMHSKPASRSMDTHSGTKIAKKLAQRGIAINAEGAHIQWFNQLETPAVAQWACASAHAIILGLIDLIPEGQHFADPVRSLRKMFRDHPSFTSISYRHVGD